jgi:hypothetical protein
MPMGLGGIGTAAQRRTRRIVPSNFPIFGWNQKSVFIFVQFPGNCVPSRT